MISMTLPLMAYNRNRKTERLECQRNPTKWLSAKELPTKTTYFVLQLLRSIHNARHLTGRFFVRLDPPPRRYFPQKPLLVAIFIFGPTLSHFCRFFCTLPVRGHCNSRHGEKNSPKTSFKKAYKIFKFLGTHEARTVIMQPLRPATRHVNESTFQLYDCQALGAFVGKFQSFALRGRTQESVFVHNPTRSAT